MSQYPIPRMTVFAILLMGAFLPSNALAQIRGPFVQQLENTRAVVAWEAPWEATATIHLSDADGNPLRTVAEPYQVKNHAVPVEGLERGTLYRYDIIESNGRSAGTGSFRTGPADGEPFSFLLIGSTAGQGGTMGQLADTFRASGVPFFINTGDMVDDSANIDRWRRQVFNNSRNLLRNACLWPVQAESDAALMRDNPETTTWNYVFALPDAQDYYSFDYGDAHFLVLNSHDDSEAQYEFAVADLEAADADWLFALWHRPAYSVGPGPSAVAMRERYAPLLARHDVDLLISGDNHNFALSKPIRHLGVDEQSHPYRQLITGGGNYDVQMFSRDALWFERAHAIPHYVHATVDGETLALRVIAPEGNELDNIVLDRAQEPADVVPYERIQLEAELSRLDAVNRHLDGWPGGLLFEPGAKEGEIRYHLRNPLPEPVTLRFDFSGLSGGVVPKQSAFEVELADGEEKALVVPVEIASIQQVYPLHSPKVRYETSATEGEVTIQPPSLGVSRLVKAPRVREEIHIDGKADEAAWERVEWQDHFVADARSAIGYQPQPASRFKALREAEHLYLLINRPLREGEPLLSFGQVTECDHFRLLLSDGETDLRYYFDVQGRIAWDQRVGLELAEEVEATSRRGDSGVVWELRIPVRGAFEIGRGRQASLRFNLMEKRDKNWYVFSPTLGQPLAPESAGQMMLAK